MFLILAYDYCQTKTQLLLKSNDSIRILQENQMKPAFEIKVVIE